MIFPLSILFVFGTLIGVFFLCYTNHITWYYSIGIAIGSSLVVLALFCLLVMVLLIFLGKHYAKTYDPKGKKRWFFMNDVAKFACWWLGVRPKMHGLEKIPKNTPIVIYANHQSYLDMFIFYTVLKEFPHATMYKKVIETYPLASGMAKALGGLSIEREDDRQALKVILKIINEVKKGVNFLIFPEGTRSKGTRLHPYKAGSFKVAQKAEVPAVILAIDGAYRLKMSIPFLPTRIYLNVVDVMVPEEWKDKNTQEMASYAQMMVEQDIQEARKKYRYLRSSKKQTSK